MDPNSGFRLDLLGFQPSGLSVTPLYKDIECAGSEVCIFMGILREEVLDGGCGGPAIDKAKDRLIFILTEGRCGTGGVGIFFFLYVCRLLYDRQWLKTVDVNLMSSTGLGRGCAG